ncbi:MAG: Rieske 2Fe-2S domain-containing protein [Ignavibacteria bacterium]|jgi:nitrite reductase/ring-hydroxylating ferredoxin subunit/uncharacterized membrane protein|nr:Rieske 2Fe-2S domain-containing protein [Ignavibacteria bacterium]MCU7505192.1 Rieske 2Fe-2S domain-containing protein [Ignavibacteria bacterium]MCU7518095.1 Rieske 2Fe-2S domain-containing protein [Ignavibacteria bacterium]
MKTRANFKGHAIHQMLIPFPIGLMIGAFAFDVLGYIFEIPALWHTGYYTSFAGALMGLMAGLPGFIDYTFSVPPNSTGFTRATKHMIFQITTIILFAIAFFSRGGVGDKPGMVVLLLELAGTVTVTIGGWMGGTLVDRNFIGPDHRYAQSGKWKEVTLNGKKGEMVEAAKTDELKVNQMKLLHINGERIVLARTEEGYLAFHDRCTHRGGPLSDGVLICSTVQCLWHGSHFDIKTGKVKSGPAKEDIKTFPVVEEDGRVMLKIN